MNLVRQVEESQAFFQSCMDIFKVKGPDYAPDSVAFREVLDTARELGTSPEKVLWVHFKKHYTAVKKYILDGRVESEPLEGRLRDLANYVALLHVLTKYKDDILKGYNVHVQVQS